MHTIDHEILEQMSLIEKYSAKEAITKKESQALIAARENIERLRKIKIFLDDNHFKNINERKGNNTPLIAAIRQNNLEMFELILSHPKIDINQSNNEQQTPVWISAATGKMAFLEKLAAKKADFTKPNADKITPLHISIKNKFFNAAAAIVYHITGFSIYDSSQYGQHPLHALCESPKFGQELIDLLNLFKKNKVDLNARNDNMETPLMIAAKRGNLTAVKWLIENGADVTLQDRSSKTFIDHISKFADKEEVFEILHQNNLNTDWLKDVHTVKEYGHVLGIGTFLKLGNTLGLGGMVHVPIEKNGKGVPVFTEDWDTTSSSKTLENELKKYTERDDLKDENFKIMHEALALFNKVEAGESTVEALHSSYKENKPVIMPVNMPGHVAGISIYKDKLIFTDRFLTSGGRINECTKIFNLKDTNDQAIKTFLSDFNESSESIDEVVEKLNKIIDFKNPILLTGDKLQMHGTCSYSNPRSNLEGVLCVLQADKLSGNQTKISDKKVIDCKMSAQESYRKFLYSGRLHKAQDLVKAIHEAEKNKDIGKVNMYYGIAESYIKGHHNRSKNDGTDWKNTLVIYQGLPEHLKKRFNKDNKSISHKIEKSLIVVRLNTLINKNKSSKDAPKKEILNEILFQLHKQTEHAHPCNLSKAIADTHLIAKKGGYEAIFKAELPKMLALFAKDHQLPKLNLKELEAKFNHTHTADTEQKKHESIPKVIHHQKKVTEHTSKRSTFLGAARVEHAKKSLSKIVPKVSHIIAEHRKKNDGTTPKPT